MKDDAQGYYPRAIKIGSSRLQSTSSLPVLGAILIERNRKMTEAIATTNKMDALANAVGESAQGFNPTPIRVKINHQEATFGIEGLPSQRRLEGLVLASQMVRVFFPRMGNDSDTSELLEITSNRPFCSSRDYVHGELDDSLENVKEDSLAAILKSRIAEGELFCPRCPLQEWESVSILGKDGRGKACADLRRLLFWQPSMTVPTVLSVPTSSIRAWDSYCSALSTIGQQHNQVITEINLESKSGGGRKWAVMAFSKTRNLDEAWVDELVSEVGMGGTNLVLARGLVKVFKDGEVSVEDYPTNGDSSEEF